MRQRGGRLSVQVEQFHGDVHPGFRHRQEEHVLEGLCNACGLFRCLPLLEKGTERHTVEDLAGHGVLHTYLAVAPEGNLVHIDAPSRPGVETAERGYGDGGLLVSAAEDIVYAKRTVLQLGRCAQGRKQCDQYDEYSFHQLKIVVHTNV